MLQPRDDADSLTPLPLEFYRRPTVDVARDLLGTVLVRRTTDGFASAAIVETEAYTGADDPASHAARGRTPRSAIMFDSPGHAYVYFIYGMYYCLNAVAFADPPGAILIRAVQPLENLAFMTERRGVAGPSCTNGPGKLAQALDVTRELNGAPLFDAASPLVITAGTRKPQKRAIVATERIGIKQARHLPYRFYLRDNPYVSRRSGG